MQQVKHINRFNSLSNGLINSISFRTLGVVETGVAGTSSIVGTSADNI